METKDWQVSYDSEVDEMFVGILPQPNNTNSFYVEGIHYKIHEGKIVGFFIEYFKSQLNLNK